MRDNFSNLNFTYILFSISKRFVKMFRIIDIFVAQYCIITYTDIFLAAIAAKDNNCNKQ